MLWSPLMDKFAIPWLGRRRGWIAVFQIALFALTLALAASGNPDAPYVIIALALAIAFASASQDIAYDAYTVDVLRPEEQGVAVGAKIAMYRAAMQAAGALSITLSAMFSWSAVIALQALCYLPMIYITMIAPEPEAKDAVAARSVRDAIWRPFLGFLSRNRALEILAFVILYKLADNLSQSLLRPFLIDMGYNEIDRGLALLTIGLACTLGGTLLGGTLTTAIGLGHSLWIFGFLQIFSNVGYLFIIWSETSRWTMIGAMSFETFTTGLGMGAFGTMLVRLTQKRFSATQYALYSSLFALPRLVAGPVTGVVVHSVGWEMFFWFTMVAGLPGLVLLHRFSPLGTREPEFTFETLVRGRTMTKPQLTQRGVFAGIVGTLIGLVAMAFLRALNDWGEEGFVFSPMSELLALLQPASYSGWFSLLGALVFGASVGLLTAAVFAARGGVQTEGGPVTPG
jgi:PAT family beta-lactamase induction signal transducer AmpG